MSVYVVHAVRTAVKYPLRQRQNMLGGMPRPPTLVSGRKEMQPATDLQRLASPLATIPRYYYTIYSILVFEAISTPYKPLLCDFS